MAKIILLIVVFTMTSMIGCNRLESDINLDTPDNDPFIHGKITDIREGSVYISILIEEDPRIFEPLEPGGKKIWLLLVDDTKIYVRNKNGTLIESSVDVFEISKQVEGWVTGVIDDSYPLQGAADSIIVIH